MPGLISRESPRFWKSELLTLTLALLPLSCPQLSIWSPFWEALTFTLDGLLLPEVLGRDTPLLPLHSPTRMPLSLLLSLPLLLHLPVEMESLNPPRSVMEEIAVLLIALSLLLQRLAVLPLEFATSLSHALVLLPLVPRIPFILPQLSAELQLEIAT